MTMPACPCVIFFNFWWLIFGLKLLWNMKCNRKKVSFEALSCFVKKKFPFKSIENSVLKTKKVCVTLRRPPPPLSVTYYLNDPLNRFYCHIHLSHNSLITIELNDFRCNLSFGAQKWLLKIWFNKFTKYNLCTLDHSGRPRNNRWFVVLRRMWRHHCHSLSYFSTESFCCRWIRIGDWGSESGWRLLRSSRSRYRFAADSKWNGCNLKLVCLVRYLNLYWCTK